MLLRSCAVALLAGLAADGTAAGLLTVLADWPHADLHVWSLREAVGHSAPAAEPSCSAILAGALSLVLLSLLSLPASPVLQMKLCPWRGSLPTKTTKNVRVMPCALAV